MGLYKLALASSLGLAALMSTSIASAQFLDINGGFEDDFDGWSRSGFVDISAREFEGDNAARIRESGAQFSRTIQIQPNTRYRYRGRINDSGQLFITLGGRTTTRTVTNIGNNYTRRTITFDSGNNTSVTIGGRYRNETSRFDDLTFQNRDNTGFGSSGGGDFGLNPNDDPWENFDLREWAIDTPAGRPGSSCRAERTEPQEWNSSFNNTDSADFFFTHSDGGMRFISEVGGATTGGSCNSRARSELREFLRGSNTNIDDTGDDGDFRNNWALGYQPNNADADFSWGAREGRMRATLVVNQVTTSGNNSNRGRTIIGQIHAKDDEPLRLNYKSIPGRSGGGCIYASSEERGGDDTNFPLLGTVSCNAGDEDGRIGLGEMFSYEIENDDEDIIVTIRAGDGGQVLAEETIDLDSIDGGYDRDDEYMYFKAGAYTQNEDNTGAVDGQRDVVTFYRLDVDH